MKAGQRFSSRVSAPIRNLAHRFTYVGLVAAAFTLMLLGKADVVLVERFRAQVTDAVAPILEIASKPIATVNNLIAQGRELADIRKENAALRQDIERLLQWQSVARILEGENKALRDQLKFVPGPQASYLTARVIADSGGA
ncbi:MAG TPA: rod shape-determining protein MreC, partial [Rhodospirillales bacterium]|nr:rod shape-determining protein MreC [Rhodospirillales bacterium]